MEAKNNPQSARVIKCVTPGGHSLPGQAAAEKPSHASASRLSLAEVKSSEDEQGDGEGGQAGGRVTDQHPETARGPKQDRTLSPPLRIHQ